MGRKTSGLSVDSIQAGHPPDRRRSPRLDLDISLIARPTKNRSRVIQGRINDMSSSGISALIAAELHLGDVLELQFGLPYTSVVVLLEAAVRRREGYRYGLEFVRVIASDREKINKACVVLDLLR